MVQVIWSPQALRDLIAIRNHIGEDRPLAARRMAQRLKDAGGSLGDFPERGRPASGERREFALIYPYIIRYQLLPEVVQIIRIKHGAQRIK